MANPRRYESNPPARSFCDTSTSPMFNALANRPRWLSRSSGCAAARAWSRPPPPGSSSARRAGRSEAAGCRRRRSNCSATSRCHAVLAGSLAASSRRMARLARYSPSAPGRSPDAASASPTRDWATASSACAAGVVVWPVPGQPPPDVRPPRGKVLQRPRQIAARLQDVALVEQRRALAAAGCRRPPPHLGPRTNRSTRARAGWRRRAVRAGRWA